MKKYKKLLYIFGLILALASTLSAVYLVTNRSSLNFLGKATESTMYAKLTDPNYQLALQKKAVLLPAIGRYASQYSPWLVYKFGWGTKLLYYCKNTLENGVATDRVWRAEFQVSDLKLLDNRIVINGTLNQEDDLSCSPGVVFGTDGTMHMYYVTASRKESMKLFLYHATSAEPGVTWTKRGRVGGQFPQPFPGYMETPSPILINGQIVMYLAGGDTLYRTTSTDGDNFSAPERLNAPGGSSGRVLYDGTAYYYFYATNPSGTFPTEIRLALSTDGKNFFYDRTLITANGSDWDGSHAWTPMPEFSSNLIRIYYAGNTGTYDWWGANTTIGYQEFLVKSASTKMLYRFWSSYFLDTYLTASEQERQNVLKYGWLEKESLGSVYDTNRSGSIPLYQFWSDYFKDHYYSVSDKEKSDLAAHGWRYDGIIGYIPASASEITKPFYKLICGTSPANHYYVFTSNEQERSQARTQGCVDTGVVGNLLK